jgi:hypothetical protein
VGKSEANFLLSLKIPGKKMICEIRPRVIIVVSCLTVTDSVEHLKIRNDNEKLVFIFIVFFWRVFVALFWGNRLN